MTASPRSRVLDAVSRTLLAPPRVAFHAVLGLFGVGLLWAGSLPGVPLVPLMWLGWLVIIGALIWTCKLVDHRRRRRRGDERPAAGRWFLLAPVGGVLIVGVLASGLAFDVRWALSRAEFEEAVASATDPARTATAADGRVGLYRVLGEPYVSGDAVLFHHPLGGGAFDDAGFAYLPTGPTPEVEASFESLRTQHIDGAWYRWWSSW